MKSKKITPFSPRQCILVPYLMLVLMYIIAADSNIDKKVFTIVSLLLSIFPICFLIWSFFQKTMSITDAQKYVGILGLYNAVVASVMLSLHWGDSLKKTVLIFLILFACCMIIIGLIECFYKIHKTEPQKKENAVAPTAGLGAAGGIIGICLSKYLRQQNIDITFEIIFILIGLVSLLFYSGFVKNRKSNHKNF